MAQSWLGKGSPFRGGWNELLRILLASMSTIRPPGTRCLLLPRAGFTPEGGTWGCGMHQLEEGPSRGTIASAISDGVVRLMSQYTGRGPTKSRTEIGRDVITVVLQDTLTKAEHSLAKDGKSDLVLQMRHEFQRIMREDLVAIVEANM